VEYSLRCGLNAQETGARLQGTDSSRSVFTGNQYLASSWEGLIGNAGFAAGLQSVSEFKGRLPNAGARCLHCRWRFVKDGL
jgi:hypothetical protein